MLTYRKSVEENQKPTYTLTFYPFLEKHDFLRDTLLKGNILWGNLPALVQYPWV
jgi:hypothetical protein